MSASEVLLINRTSAEILTDASQDRSHTVHGLPQRRKRSRSGRSSTFSDIFCTLNMLHARKPVKLSKGNLSGVFFACIMQVEDVRAKTNNQNVHLRICDGQFV